MCFEFPTMLLLPPSLGNTTKVTFPVPGSPPKVLVREKLALLRWPPRKLPFGRLDAPGAGNVAAGADKQAPAGSRGAGGRNGVSIFTAYGPTGLTFLAIKITSLRVGPLRTSRPFTR